jgi:hypothetical protein
MGLAIGIGNGILFTSQRGVSSIIPKLIIDICARATYCENKTCTTSILLEIENIQYTASAVPVGFLASYPGASAAYSLRNLIDTTTNVVRVRRSSDNREQDFSATQITDGTLTTFTGANDGLVTIWYDQSSNGYDFAQSSAINQPKIVNSGVLILENGKPSIKWDGSNDRLSNSSEISANLSDYSFFAVVKKTTGWLFDTSIGRMVIDLNQTLASKFYAGNSGRGSQIINNNQSLRSFFLDSSNGADVYVDGDLNQGGLTYPQEKITSFQTLGSDINSGGGTFSNMSLQEFIIYNSVQSSNRVGIETNINNEYDVYRTNEVSGLLFDYPGSIGAYSLRQLVFYQDGHTPNLIRVRRSSDNAEQNFTATEITDGTLTTFTGANDGFITTWYNQARNIGDLISATAANQPQIVSSGTSLGYIQSLGSTQLNSDIKYINSTDYSTFFVGQNTGQTVWGADSGTGYYAVALAGSNNGNVSGFTEGNRYSNGSLIGATWGDMYNALSSFAQVTALVRRQSVDRNIRIGFNTYNNGRYKELIIYGNQSVSRTGVETNIINHYNF